MKVLYDMTYTQGSSFYSGLYEYGKKNLENKIDKVDVLVFSKYEVDSYLEKNCNLIYISGDHDNKEHLRNLYNLSKQYDVIYFPYQLTTRKIRLAKNCKMIFTIHDLAQLDLASVDKSNKYEKYFLTGFKDHIKYLFKMISRITHIWHHKLYKMLSYNIKHATKIIAVSNATKEDILKRFNVPSEKVRVCYSPIKFSENSTNSTLDYNDYFLFVSASRYTKNVINAIKAFDLYKDKNQNNRKFIITGKLPERILNISKHKKDIVALGYLDNKDLEYLYEHANGLIFTSFFEGFGMPPLEAMKYGTPVLCSNIACLREIYSNALFANPYNVSSIEKKMEELDNVDKQVMIENYNIVKEKCEDALKLHSDIIFK